MKRRSGGTGRHTTTPVGLWRQHCSRAAVTRPAPVAGRTLAGANRDARRNDFLPHRTTAVARRQSVAGQCTNRAFGRNGARGVDARESGCGADCGPVRVARHGGRYRPPYPPASKIKGAHQSRPRAPRSATESSPADRRAWGEVGGGLTLAQNGSSLRAEKRAVSRPVPAVHFKASSVPRGRLAGTRRRLVKTGRGGRRTDLGAERQFRAGGIAPRYHPGFQDQRCTSEPLRSHAVGWRELVADRGRRGEVGGGPTLAKSGSSLRAVSRPLHPASKTKGALQSLLGPARSAGGNLWQI